MQRRWPVVPLCLRHTMPYLETHNAGYTELCTYEFSSPAPKGIPAYVAAMRACSRWPALSVQHAYEYLF
jgi:hypothetical protein